MRIGSANQSQPRKQPGTDVSRWAPEWCHLWRQITGGQAESRGTNVGPRGRKRRSTGALFVDETIAVTCAYGFGQSAKGLAALLLQWRDNSKRRRNA
jgi:hypothetical protein